MIVRVTQTGFILLEGSAQILHTIFPHYPDVTDCHKTPDLEYILAGEQYEASSGLVSRPSDVDAHQSR